MEREDRAARRTRRRFARRQWARRWLSLRYVLALLVVVALLGTSIWLVFFSATLQVKRVEVVGNDLLSDGRVREIADVPLGEQLALVDLDRADARVGSLAEVKSVDVTRTWPDGVRIEVVERTAVAVVELAGRLRGLDADGVVFREYKTRPEGDAARPARRRGRHRRAQGGRDRRRGAARRTWRAASTTSRSRPSTRSPWSCATSARCCGGARRSPTLKAEVVDKLLAAQKAPFYDVSVPGQPDLPLPDVTRVRASRLAQKSAVTHRRAACRRSAADVRCLWSVRKARLT